MIDDCTDFMKIGQPKLLEMTRAIYYDFKGLGYVL